MELDLVHKAEKGHILRPQKWFARFSNAFIL